MENLENKDLTQELENTNEINQDETVLEEILNKTEEDENELEEVLALLDEEEPSSQESSTETEEEEPSSQESSTETEEEPSSQENSAETEEEEPSSQENSTETEEEEPSSQEHEQDEEEVYQEMVSAMEEESNSNNDDSNNSNNNNSSGDDGVDGFVSGCEDNSQNSSKASKTVKTETTNIKGSKNNSTPHEYVVAGAYLECSNGSHCMPLMVPVCKGMAIKNKNVASQLDMIPMANIMPFVICSSPVIPPQLAVVPGVEGPRYDEKGKVKSGTGGTPVKGIPCVPAIISPWQKTYSKTTLSMLGSPTLTPDSFTVCALGGIVKICNSGQ